MLDIAARTREEALAPAPAKTAQARKRGYGMIALGLSIALGLGLAGGTHVHRLIDLDQATTWLQQAGSTLQSGFETVRREVSSRISGLTSSPTSVSSDGVSWKDPSRDEIVSRMVGDLSLRMDQIRAVHDGSARDLGQGIERIRSEAEGNHHELVARLAQLTERVERVERQAASATAPAATQAVVQQPTTPPSPKPVARIVPQPAPDTKPVIKPAPRSATEAKAKIAPKMKSPDAKPSMDAKGIANWTVRYVFDDTAVLDGPQGPVAVGPGDTIPGIGRIQAIVRSGGRWVVATTNGVITPRVP